MSVLDYPLALAEVLLEASGDIEDVLGESAVEELERAYEKALYEQQYAYISILKKIERKILSALREEGFEVTLEEVINVIEDEIMNKPHRVKMMIHRYAKQAVDEIMGEVESEKVESEIIHLIEKLEKKEDTEEVVIKIDELLRPIDEKAKELYRDVAELQYQFSAKAMKMAEPTLEISAHHVPEDLQRRIMDFKEIELIGDYAASIDDLLHEHRKSIVNKIIKTVKAGVMKRKSVDQIVRDVRQLSANVSRKDTRTVIKTMLAIAQNRAMHSSYEQFGDDLKGWIHQSVLDNRTTLLCASLDGKKYWKSRGWTWEKMIAENRVPPLHFNCRSTLLPLTNFTNSLLNRIMRPSVTDDKAKLVPAKMTFQEWFDKQPEAWKLKYLGQSRYNLYRKNKLKLDSFVDIQDGHVYTLDEIRAHLRRNR